MAAVPLMYPKTELSNRLRVISAPMPQMESVALGVWIAAGGRYESARLCGVSHFLEHLMFKGTLSRTARQIKEAIEGLGGAMNAFTDVEATCLYAKVPAKHAAVTLDVLLDMAFHARLSAGDIERERQVILEEIKMYLDAPMQYVQDLLGTVMWPRHPLGMFLAGTQQSVGRIRRLDIAAYCRRFYTPATLETLPEDLQFTGAGVTLVERRDLWDMPVFFLLLVGLVGAEWAFRRKRGLV